MPKGKATDPETKAEILRQIRDHGISVTDANSTYGVSPKNIYRWLQEHVVDGNRNLVLELNRLRKENEQLYKLLGRATAEMQRSKK